MNSGQLKTSNTKFILQLVLTMAFFLGSTVTHDLMHLATQDDIFETDHHNCKSLKNIMLALGETAKILIIAPIMFMVVEYTSQTPPLLRTWLPRGPPKV
jgi:hypothetical protein